MDNIPNQQENQVQGYPPRPAGFDAISIQAFLLLIVAAVFLYEIQWILLPFVIAGLIAYICTPVIEWLARYSRLPRPLVAVAVFLALVTAGMVMGSLGIPPFIQELGHVITDFQQVMRGLAQGIIGDRSISLFGRSMNAAQIADEAVKVTRDWAGQFGIMLRIGLVAFSTIFGLFLTLVLLFYFLVGGPKIAQGLFWMVPAELRPTVEHVSLRLDPVLKRYFIGVLIIVAYATVAAYIGLGVVLHIPHAPFLALLTGILEMLPVIGPGAAAIIAGLVAVEHASGIGPIIAYAIYASALRLSIDQLLGPIALGAAARLHPVLIIFCFLAGGFLFGPVGVIMAVPVALVTKLTVGILRSSHGERGLNV